MCAGPPPTNNIEPSVGIGARVLGIGCRIVLLPFEEGREEKTPPSFRQIYGFHSGILGPGQILDVQNCPLIAQERGPDRRMGSRGSLEA